MTAPTPAENYIAAINALTASYEAFDMPSSLRWVARAHVHATLATVPIGTYRDAVNPPEVGPAGILGETK